MEGDFSDDEEFEIEPVKPDKGNFVFGMHPLQPEHVVIDPNYPPQFFPYLYPHLYPHLFPKLFPHYAKNYEKIMKKKEKKSKKKEKRDIIVVLPDGRNIMMSRKEFLAYQLALAQMGHKVSDKDLQPIKKDPLFEESRDNDAKSVALSANIPSDEEATKKNKTKKAGNKGGKDKDKDVDNLLKDLDGEGNGEGPGKPKLLDPTPVNAGTGNNTNKNSGTNSKAPNSRNSKSNAAGSKPSGNDKEDNSKEY